jgi:hypothetical protein
LLFGVVSLFIHEPIAFIFASLSIITIVIAGSIQTIDLVKNELLNQTESSIKIIKGIHKKEIELIEGLSKFKSEDLKIVADRFKAEKERIEKRSNIITGALDKVGIIPAVATLYLSYLGYRKDAQAFVGEYIIVAIFIGIYIGAVLANTITITLENLTRITNEAVNIAEQQNSYTNPS